jgi:hypothetical protein
MQKLQQGWPNVRIFLPIKDTFLCRNPDIGQASPLPINVPFPVTAMFSFPGAYRSEEKKKHSIFACLSYRAGK